MPGQSRSHYPKFANLLYALARVMGDSRDVINARSNFTTTDLAAFDTLLSAVQAGTAYFPNYIEPE